MNLTLHPIHKNLMLLISFCVLLLMIRMKITNSFFYAFLIWNLFLASIPFLISESLKKRNIQRISKLKLIIILFIWLIFLPNAPYIITDFIHLNHSKSSLFWYDMILLFIFATTGLILAILSLSDIHKIVHQKWNKKTAQYCITVVSFLCGFGIYLGRFLRLNSWDILTNPITVMKQILASFNDPKTWFITISFGLFLYILFLVYKQLKVEKTYSSKLDI